MMKGNKPFAPSGYHLYEAAGRLVNLQHAAELSLLHDDPQFSQQYQQWPSDDGTGAAYVKIASTLRDLKDCTRPPLPTEAECSTDGFDGSVSVAMWLAKDRHRDVVNLPNRRAHWRRARQAIPLVLGAGAGVAAIVLSGLVWRTQSFDNVATYATGTAENREVRLPDSSTVMLGAKTALTRYYTNNHRTVVLNSGEGFFDVAHDPSRPFIVLAGDGYIKAIGTSFNILRNSDRVVVTVIDGVVDVAPGEPSLEDGGTSRTTPTGIVKWQPTRLIHGQEMSYGENGAASVVTSANSGAATAWRNGQLQYRQESLRHVIMDVNRYWRRQIVYDRETGELMYGGNVPLDNIDGWVRDLQLIFPVEVLDVDPAHVLVRSHREPGLHNSRRGAAARR